MNKSYKLFSQNKVNSDGPMLDYVKINLAENIDFTQYPFCLEIIKKIKKLKFPNQVTFLVGENGSGKSTILETIAFKAGFGAEGGSKNISFQTSEEKNYAGIKKLADYITLSWRNKPHNGYFFRAESFYNIANYIDILAQQDEFNAYAPYGGKSLHQQSHGESFLSFFSNRLGNGGFFILDEPEAALSPQRQLSLLIIINEMCKKYNSQFIIATHSPILLAYPDSTIYSCDTSDVIEIAYTDTEHYKITKSFLNNTDKYLQNLFEA